MNFDEGGEGKEPMFLLARMKGLKLTREEFCRELKERHLVAEETEERGDGFARLVSINVVAEWKKYETGCLICGKEAMYKVGELDFCIVCREFVHLSYDVDYRAFCLSRGILLPEDSAELEEQFITKILARD